MNSIEKHRADWAAELGMTDELDIYGTANGFVTATRLTLLKTDDG
jgi:hypothetical protein